MSTSSVSSSTSSRPRPELAGRDRAAADHRPGLGPGHRPDHHRADGDRPAADHGAAEPGERADGDQHAADQHPDGAADGRQRRRGAARSDAVRHHPDRHLERLHARLRDDEQRRRRRRLPGVGHASWPTPPSARSPTRARRATTRSRSTATRRRSRPASRSRVRQLDQHRSNATVYAAATNPAPSCSRAARPATPAANYIQVSDPGGALTEQTGRQARARTRSSASTA